MTSGNSKSATWEAYSTTTYRMKSEGSEDVEIRLQQRSPVPGPMAYITADNPGSRQLPVGENDRRRAALRAALTDSGYEVISGESIDDDGSWPTERGFWIRGLNRDEARAMGGRFEQNAILFVDAQSSVELIDCRISDSSK